jgi:hypothetical protein
MTMTADPADPTAILAGIKEDLRKAGLLLAGEDATLLPVMLGRHASSLLGAVEAVLKDHRPGRVVIFGSLCKRHESHRHFSIDAREAADVRACQDCGATVYNSCTGCTGASWAECPVRLAITRELTGKEAPRG